MEPAKLTPMIRQYLEIKERYRDAILFFRLGDFYEMFFDDAEKASKILDIALTSRSRSEEGAVPLCGVPYHSMTPYVGKLLDAGYKVAICEQVEDPKEAKGIVQREVVRVVTPGTVTDSDALEARDNSFLAAVARGKNGFGLALTDVTTGEFRFTIAADYAALKDELGRVQPRELIHDNSEEALAADFARDFPGVHLSPAGAPCFAASAMERLKALDLWSAPRDPEWEQGIRAAAAIVAYLDDNSPKVVKALRDLRSYSSSQYLMLDETTRRNLELTADFQGNKKNSLFGVIDRTDTAMGARRLRQWLLYPLLDERAIRARQEGVEELVENYRGRQELKELLRRVQDLERLGGRVVAGSAQPRDLVAVKETLRAVQPIKTALGERTAGIFASIAESMTDLPHVVGLIEQAIVDDPPAAVKDGETIRPGFNVELDELRSIRKDAKQWVARFEAAEKKRTGVQSLKVRYNRVFGYYIEVTRANLAAVPPDYIRKQTLANGERYITSELKEYEAKILNSEEEIQKLELSLFAQVRERIAAEYLPMKRTADTLADLDALLSLAEAAHSEHFVRPKLDGGREIFIREGRHSVVEAVIGRAAFVPNDCRLDPDSRQIVVLTGPNMAGKSTYMRQVALIVVLAQMGGFVPAAEARIGLVDRIFTRIGAADYLARGESTFMVEMRETAHILRHATARSLILLDEVGRGTSTFDGISIAWSVAESLHDSPHRPRTLFATHYHELTDLALTNDRVKNFNFAVKEWKGEVIFLRSLVEGAASRSYGIHVAKLAGLPASVIERAKEILKNLEGGELDERGRPRLARGARKDEAAQMPLFVGEDKLRSDLKDIEVATLTPIDALNLLNSFVERVKKEND
ncbi:MAG TPA: DNA mismatch repair protein MutS [Verrucomicrobiae bacterium]|jgi:DNA mismatch repair protein MutS|nr:DNA mismatch repair protein MutS [Verrucomicrobiae bacterium]